MYYYLVLVPNKMNLPPLYYKSRSTITSYSIVKVPLGKSEELGFIVKSISFEQIGCIDISIEKILDIIYIYNIRIPIKTINFIRATEKTTFLTINDLSDQILRNIELHLGKKGLESLLYHQIIEDGINEKSYSDAEIAVSPLLDFKLYYYIDIFIVLRIIYLIRTCINRKINNIKKDLYKESQMTSRNNLNIDILIFFSEIKELQSNLSQFEIAISKLENDLKLSSEFNDVEFRFNLNIFTNEKNKASKNAILDVLKTDVNSKSNNFNQEYENIANRNNNVNTSYNVKSSIIREQTTVPVVKMVCNVNIYALTKVGMFITFKNVDTVIVINEASSFYIQEQNTLYYDLREIIYLFCSCYGCDLNFISTLPSLRLYKHISNGLSGLNLVNTLNERKTPLELQINGIDFSVEEKNALFSFATLNVICEND